MASVTLTSVRTLVRNRGDIPRARKFTDSYVDDEIQTSWTALHRLVEDVNEGYFDRSENVSTVAEQAWVPLPSTCRKVKGVDFLDGSEFRELDQIGIAERNRYGQTADEPIAYRLTERGIDLFPTPRAVFTLRVTFSRKVVPLSGIVVEIDDEWQDYVVWATILRIATSEERPTGDYQTAVAQAEAAIRASASGRRRQEPESLVLREYAPSWWGIY